MSRYGNNWVRSVLVFAVLGALGVFAQEPEEGRRPNIIFLMADDLSPRWFGAYGEQEGLHTPNIDRMAAEGVCFRTAWCTPMCSPTRALVMTGQYGMRTGWLHNQLKIPDENGNTDFLRRGVKTFAHVLKKAGYKTAFAGRWGIPANWTLAKQDYHEFCMHASVEPALPEGVELKEIAEEGEVLLARLSLDPATYDGTQETTFRVESKKGYGGEPFYSRYWHPAIVKNDKLVLTQEEDFGSDIFTDFVIDFARRNKAGPFLVYYPMFLPHGTSVKVPSGISKLPSTPLTGRPGDIRGGTMKECSTYCDVLIGRIMAGLEREGLLGNTILIFAGDNADAGGPGGVRAGKTAATDNGARVPMVIWGPGVVKKRGLTDELCEFADLFPTFADFAAAPLPAGQELDGQSMKNFLIGNQDTHRDWIASYIGTARMIRDKRYLIEAADPVFGAAEGRFYDCGDSRGGFGYTMLDPETSERANTAYLKLKAALDSLPQVDFDEPGAKEALEKYKTAKWIHRLK